jgi:hypothetical protein
MNRRLPTKAQNMPKRMQQTEKPIKYTEYPAGSKIKARPGHCIEVVSGNNTPYVTAACKE